MQIAFRSRAVDRGFTILETLVAMSIFLVVLYGVYMVYDTGQQSYETGKREWDVQSQARVALERMAREIRMAGYGPTKVNNPIRIATNDTFSFDADVDNNGTVETITYARRDCAGSAASTLYRNASTTTYCGGDAFIDGVTGLTFAYYEINNLSIPYPLTSTYQLDGQAHVTGAGAPSAPGTQRNAVRQVKISLTLQQNMSGRIIPFSVTTDVTLRNLVP